MGYLRQAGFQSVDDPRLADYLIINTCGFIETARQESIEEILRLSLLKNSNGHHKRLLVTGCLAQRYHDDLVKEIPEIDGMIGIDQYDRINSILTEDKVVVAPSPTVYREFAASATHRQRSFAYLKIADGCDSGCSYCAIPAIRGRYRSRRLEAIAADIDRLLEAGVLELNLIAQDVARYGFDIGKRPLDLLELIEQRPEKFWLRPFYLHPVNITDEILDFLQDSNKFCNYLEIPIQHASTKLLQRMNRGYDRDYLERLLARISGKLPDTVWRTTFIVGFPGETEGDFKQLCDFIEEHKVCRGGVFTYSREEETAAYNFRPRPRAQTANARQEIVQNLINENAERFNLSLVGRRLSMLPETFSTTKGFATGRLYCDAPQIDFHITVPAQHLDRREFHSVQITATTPEGFVGELIDGGKEC